MDRGLGRVGQTLVKLFDGLLMGTCYFGGVACLIMMVIVTYDVIMRYFFNNPTIWVIDISTLGVPFITLLGAAWVLKRDMHIKIDIIPKMLSLRSRALLDSITSALAFLACIIFLWQGWELTWEAYTEQESLFRSLIIPKHLVLWPFPFGAFLLCIQFVRRIGGYIGVYRRVRPQQDKE